jgi:hypothetical protein
MNAQVTKDQHCQAPNRWDSPAAWLLWNIDADGETAGERSRAHRIAPFPA